MTWTKLDDRFHDDPDIAALTDGAYRLYVGGLVYAGRHLTDGAVYRRILKALQPRRPFHHAQQLVDAGLWIETEDGWKIKNYLHYQPSKAQVEARREATRKRVQKHRSNTVTPPLVTVPPSRPVTDSPSSSSSPLRGPWLDDDELTTIVAGVAQRRTNRAQVAGEIRKSVSGFRQAIIDNDGDLIRKRAIALKDTHPNLGPLELIELVDRAEQAANTPVSAGSPLRRLSDQPKCVRCEDRGVWVDSDGIAHECDCKTAGQTPIPEKPRPVDATEAFYARSEPSGHQSEQTTSTEQTP